APSMGPATAWHAEYTGIKSAATCADAPKVSAYTASRGRTMLSPSTSTSTIKKMGNSGARCCTGAEAGAEAVTGAIHALFWGGDATPSDSAKGLGGRSLPARALDMTRGTTLHCR